MLAFYLEALTVASLVAVSCQFVCHAKYCREKEQIDASKSCVLA